MTLRFSLWASMLASALAFVGCAGADADVAVGSSNLETRDAAECDPRGARAVPLELFVEPDMGTAPFTEAIERATSSVDLMVYEMGFGPILDGLIAKAQAGVHVRVILDLAQRNVNERYRQRLADAGADVIWSDPTFTFMHAKVILVDRREAIVSTGNFGASFMARERNFAVHDTDAADVASLETIFDADFGRVTPDLSCTRLLVAPVNARARLHDVIASATKTIIVESMQLADRDIRDALAARKAAGVDVRVLLADPTWIDGNTSAATFLAAQAIPARYMHAPAVHVKALVVDGNVAYVGSINLSYNSIEKNREVGLLVTEPENVATMTATFERDWATATSFQP
jgi:phosphatidylserine/phosphatidylglycerophosphate/cardiolipin synthase-like enzyme